MAQISSLLKTVAAFPDPAKKRVSAVLGAVVADAASLPLDWIYDDAKMKDIVGEKEPEFWTECKCPFFTVSTGNVSCYNDEMLTTLKSLAANNSAVDISKISGSIQEHFGSEDSPYQVALAKRAEKKYPVAGPWINGGVIKFLKNVSEGVSPPGSLDNEDNDGFTVSLPVLLKEKSQVEDVAKLLTTNPMTLGHLKLQTRILENYLEGVESPIEAAQEALLGEIPEICQEVDLVKQAVETGKSLGEIIAEFGKACSLPGSFQGSIAALLKYSDYVSALRANIVSGGDCCSRANFIGACLAARGGVEVIPMEWIEKVDGIQEIIEAAIKVYQS